MKTIKQFIEESVAHGKSAELRKFPNEPNRETVERWLEMNGFKLLGKWKDLSYDKIRNAKGLRYYEGQFDRKDPTTHWIMVEGNDSSMSLSIQVGKSDDGKYLESRFTTAGVSDTVKFSDMDDYLRKIKDGEP